jgi:putative oxidoreductase
MAFGLLILRLVIGVIFIGHGAQKLFGLFGGGGRRGTERMVASLGFRGAGALAVLAGVAEFFGGLLVLLGLVTPFGAAAIIGMMTAAIVTVHVPRGFWNTNGGIEFPLALMAAAACLSFTGPGRISLDAVAGLDWRGLATGFFVVAVGVGAGAIVSFLGRERPTALGFGEGEEEHRGGLENRPREPA